VALPCGWIAGRVATRYGVPYVLTEHRSPFEENLVSRWSTRMTQEALEGAREVIALSPSLAASISRAFPTITPTVIGEVVHDPNRSWKPMRRSTRSESVRIASVGGLRHQKGIAHLVKAVASLVGAGLDLNLEIAGDGPLRAELEDLVVACGLESRCRFLGLVPRSQVFDLYRNSDLAVVSSLHETFCLAAAEALAHGIPVVTTRCGGPEHFIGDDNGATVAAGDAKALAEGIRDVVERLGSFDPREIRRDVLDTYGPVGFLRALLPIYDRAVRAA
jgi:glycosyltransferase involved in cell wall biosynthesis